MHANAEIKTACYKVTALCFWNSSETAVLVCMQAKSAADRASAAERELRAARKAEAGRAAELQQLQSRLAELERDAAALPQMQQRIENLEDQV